MNSKKPVRIGVKKAPPKAESKKPAGMYGKEMKNGKASC